MSNFILLLVSIDNFVDLYDLSRSFSLDSKVSKMIIKKAMRLFNILVLVIMNIQNIYLIITMSYRAMLNIKAIQIFDELSKFLTMPKKNIITLKIKLLSLIFIGFTFSMTLTVLPVLRLRYNSNWIVCLKIFILCVRYMGIMCIVLFYWAFGYAMMLYLDSFSNILNWSVTTKRSVKLLRFSAWRLEQIVKYMNNSFGIMILLTLTTTNVYLHYDLQEFLHVLIPCVVYGRTFYDGVLRYAAWVVMDFFHVLMLLYPAIKINSKVIILYNYGHYFALLNKFTGETSQTTIGNDDKQMFDK